MTSDDRSVHHIRSDADPAEPGSPAEAAEMAAALDVADTADAALRRSLRALPVPVDAGRLSALEARVLDDWRGAPGRTRSAVRPVPVGSRAWPWRRVGASAVAGAGTGPQAPGRRGRPAWALASVVLLGMAFAAAGLWPRLHGSATDPVLEELLQPDVLSQMAVGEM